MTIYQFYSSYGQNNSGSEAFFRADFGGEEGLSNSETSSRDSSWIGTGSGSGLFLVFGSDFCTSIFSSG